VLHTVDAGDDSRRWPAVCIAVGGLVRIRNLGPADLTTSSNRAECAYEGGVHDCRLTATGTVSFTVARPQGSRTLTVMVARASSPPKASPACRSASTVLILDHFFDGPGVNAQCMKVGASVLFRMVGPEGSSITPSDAVTCSYEGGSRRCRLIRAATVTFTIARPDVSRSLTVVAIR
jgi:hypothetical protein